MLPAHFDASAPAIAAAMGYFHFGSRPLLWLYVAGVEHQNAVKRDLISCEPLADASRALVFHNRLPSSLERAASLTRLVQWRRKDAGLTLVGSKHELRASDRANHEARLTQLLRNAIGGHLRRATTNVVYVIEKPFVSIREYSSPVPSYRDRKIFECAVTAIVECDIQVYGVACEPELGIPRTAPSNRFDASL